jgi:acetyl esterase/lipase
MSVRGRLESSIARTILRLPPPMIARILGTRRTCIDGIYLDPTVQLALLLLKWSGRPELHQLEVRESRRLFRQISSVCDLHPRPSVPLVEDRSIPGPLGAIPIRIYRGIDGERRMRLPALVYFHGGGFVVGDLASHDAPCRELARAAECAVIAVDYRLAPEHKFPAAVEDAYAALRWVMASAEELAIDGRRLAVGGDSAGGNLSTVIARMSLSAGGTQPIAELLIYPATDMRGGTSSRKKFASGFFLQRGMIDWFMRSYGPDPLDPRASPILAPDIQLMKLPPTLLVTAGFDPLKDEGRAYAEKLRSLGVEVEHNDYETMVHGFFSMAGTLEDGRRLLADSARWLKAKFRLA